MEKGNTNHFEIPSTWEWEETFSTNLQNIMDQYSRHREKLEKIANIFHISTRDAESIFNMDSGREKNTGIGLSSNFFVCFLLTYRLRIFWSFSKISTHELYWWGISWIINQMIQKMTKVPMKSDSIAKIYENDTSPIPQNKFLGCKQPLAISV